MRSIPTTDQARQLSLSEEKLKIDDECGGVRQRAEIFPKEKARWNEAEKKKKGGEKYKEIVASILLYGSYAHIIRSRERPLGIPFKSFRCT